MSTSRPTFTARMTALFGKLRLRKRPAADPNALLVDQQQAAPDQFRDRWGGYGPEPQSPSDFTASL
ncbi:MAG TPA: hypothetical protein VHC49_24330 [Mycobacteriales bacterium]|nr:hypothetical protein [Mycobacteriales bacterium]